VALSKPQPILEKIPEKEEKSQKENSETTGLNGNLIDNLGSGRKNVFSESSQTSIPSKNRPSRFVRT